MDEAKLQRRYEAHHTLSRLKFGARVSTREIVALVETGVEALRDWVLGKEEAYPHHLQFCDEVQKYLRQHHLAILALMKKEEAL